MKNIITSSLLISMLYTAAYGQAEVYCTSALDCDNQVDYCCATWTCSDVAGQVTLCTPTYAMTLTTDPANSIVDENYGNCKIECSGATSMI
jgi:hypothetical protein